MMGGSWLLGSVFAKSLRDQIKAILAWGGTLAVLSYAMLIIYPSIEGLSQLNDLLNTYPQLGSLLGDVASFTTIEGYITSQFLIFVPLILGFYAIQTASSMIAEETARGTMDFLLAHPIPRWRVVLEKYAALLVALVTMGLLTGLGLWLGALTIGTSIGVGAWLLAGLNVIPLTLFFGSLAYLLVCATPGRGIAIGVAALVAIGGFLASGLAPLVETLHAHREWTIYYLFAASKPLSSGLAWGDTVILLGGCLVCLLGALFAFNNRDILA